MDVIKSVVILVGSGLGTIIIIYWLVGKYVDYRKEKNRGLSDAMQASMQENIVTGVILIILITLVAWWFLALPR